MINIKPLNLKKLLALVSLSVFSTAFVFANNVSTSGQSLDKKIAEIEAIHGGEIGFSAINTFDNKRLEHNANERFPMCSTYKFILVAAVLKESMKDVLGTNKLS